MSPDNSCLGGEVGPNCVSEFMRGEERMSWRQQAGCLPRSFLIVKSRGGGSGWGRGQLWGLGRISSLACVFTVGNNDDAGNRGMS